MYRESQCGQQVFSLRYLKPVGKLSRDFHDALLSCRQRRREPLQQTLRPGKGQGVFVIANAQMDTLQPLAGRRLQSHIHQRLTACIDMAGFLGQYKLSALLARHQSDPARTLQRDRTALLRHACLVLCRVSLLIHSQRKGELPGLCLKGHMKGDLSLSKALLQDLLLIAAQHRPPVGHAAVLLHLRNPEIRLA